MTKKRLSILNLIKEAVMASIGGVVAGTAQKSMAGTFQEIEQGIATKRDIEADVLDAVAPSARNVAVDFIFNTFQVEPDL
jgi:hypothetical protein